MTSWSRWLAGDCVKNVLELEFGWIRHWTLRVAHRDVCGHSVAEVTELKACYDRTWTLDVDQSDVTLSATSYAVK